MANQSNSVNRPSAPAERAPNERSTPAHARLLPYTTVALAVFLAGAFLGTLLTIARLQFMHVVLGPQMIDKIEHHQMWTESILTAKPQESSRINDQQHRRLLLRVRSRYPRRYRNLLLMFTTGMSIGVITTACTQHHMALNMWSFVAAHGGLELPSIFIAGDAGLRLASGLLFPGMLRRRDALALAGAESIRLLSGTISLLTITGILEAFLSSTHAPLALKFSVCAVLLTGLGLWLSEGGREKPTSLTKLTNPALAEP